MMKVSRYKTIKFSIFLTLILLFGQTVLSQGNLSCIETNFLLFDDVMDKFRFPRGLSAAQINEQLIPEILKNKAGFDLNVDREKQLRLAGANDLLIKTIGENLLPENQREAIRLYRIYQTHYEFTDETNVKIAINAANNFIAKFGNDECYQDQIEYLRNAVPLLEKILNKTYICDPADPKVIYKYELLSKVENAYKQKNWDEVFTIGERVLEIDPEYIDLILVLASLGFEQSRTPVNKDRFNSETIRYAERAIELLESGKTLNTQNYGALHFRFFSKTEALDKMKKILDFMKNQNLYKTTPESIK